MKKVLLTLLMLLMPVMAKATFIVPCEAQMNAWVNPQVAQFWYTTCDGEYWYYNGVTFVHMQIDPASVTILHQPITVIQYGTWPVSITNGGSYPYGVNTPGPVSVTNNVTIGGPVTLGAGAATIGSVSITGTIPAYGVTVVNGGVSLLTGTANIGGVSILAPVTINVGGVSLLTGVANIGGVSILAPVTVGNLTVPVTLGPGSSAIGGVSVLGTAGVSVTNPLAITFSDNGPLTFTATGVPAAVPVTLSTTQGRMKSGSIQVKKTGAVTSWDVRLEISVDGVNYSQLLAATDIAPGDGNIIATGAVLTPFKYYRVSANSISLGGGTNVITNVTVMP